RLERIPARQHRLLLGGAHIGPDEAVALFDRIPRLSHLVAMLAAFGLARLIEAFAVDAEEPAVIAAADALIFDTAVIERRAAMGAARIEQSRPAFAVAEKNQTLAEDAHVLWLRPDLFRQRDRMPIAAHELAAGRARPDLGQLGIVLLWAAAIGRAFIGLEF